MTGEQESKREPTGEAAAAAPEGWPDGDAPLRAEPVAAGDGGTLIVDVGGFEGPLDLLLELARQHKVDLKQISILKLAEQYLDFIEKARKLQLEIAADYLVMAAWLAYLKSRLLIPAPPGPEEQEPADLAARLAFRLRRLQAMRTASENLLKRGVLGRDVFARGAPEPILVDTRRQYADNLIDLLKAYADRRKKKLAHRSYVPLRHPTWSIKEARTALERMVGVMDDWGALDIWLAQYMAEPGMRRSVTASSFTASLELAREGLLELRQEGPFRPIYVRRRASAA
ncbi:ScpA family protein [Aestuariivirga sp.]|uniref:segregation and condensation protein A n=1 Tax=Aestuariivirga sp. TaxID=2650926 RepID=UPI0025BF707E|nr:ScpA family protein [Aestuariivirga sp.]MCA3556526.1 segregation/condensation protein A [Aestuariivirga sp.]